MLQYKSVHNFSNFLLLYYTLTLFFYLYVWSEGSDVYLVDIVDDDGWDGDDLCRARGHDGHQDQEQDRVFT